ncbi:MAG TPA: hypothetical protein VKA47_13320 [Solirubrobacterales bacterium]|nr:hypothetical protein [Solirubrobacterales bacterium]
MVGSLERDRRVRRLSAAGALAAAVITLVLVSPVLAGSRGPGDLDRSFGHGGLLVVNRAHDFANAVDIGRKGRIVVAGFDTIARRRPNGHPDRSFGKRGLVRLESGVYENPGSYVAVGSSAVAVGPKGAVFVAGRTCSGGCSDFAVSRLTPDGELDQSFGQGGTARIGFEKPDSAALSIAIATGGRLVVGGSTCTSRSCKFALARLDRNGELDPSFGNGGRVTGSFGGGCSFPLGGMALDSRERIVVGGSCQSRIASLARFKPNGEPDRSFGHGGRVTRHVRINGVNALAVDSHDRIDLAGENLNTFGVVRFGSGGKFDSSFGRHGIARADFRRVDFANPHSLKLDSRDRIVVGGYAHARGLGFARFKPDGQINHRFGHDGTRTVGRSEGFSSADSVAIDRRDRIVAAGRQKRNGNPHFGLARLLG